MLRALFYLFVALAFLGDARIFLFVMNRVVFGTSRQEQSPYKPLLLITPPVLLGLTILFWPLNLWIARLLSAPMVEKIAPARIETVRWPAMLANIGAAWLIIAASVGIYWVVDRVRQRMMPSPQLKGTRTEASETVIIRRAHIPFAWLRNLGAHNDLYDLEVTRHEVFIDDLPEVFDGYRIAFLTDTHVASFVRRAYYRTIIGQVQRFGPDLVLFGGDFVSWRRHIPLMAQVLTAGLSARDGCFAILGNHDYWAGADEIVSMLSERGVRFIVNEAVPLRRDGSTLWLAGVDEVYRGRPDPDAAVGAIPLNEPRVVISHHPDIIEILAEHRIDLLLCGHTHGGQIRFPFFGAVVCPSRHETLYASGFHRLRNVLMYVSRGIGAIPPIRILCKPELPTFTLRRGLRTT